jgi:uncharacterized membrane protein YhhN
MAGLLVAASLCVGLVYAFLPGSWPPPATIAVKGAAVGLLALAAASWARRVDQWLLTILLALGAVGDVLLELSLAAGAAAFASAHIASIALYRRNRRPDAPLLDRVLAGLLLATAAALPALLLSGRPEALAFTGYSLVLGTMVATAWLSAFSRRLVGAGALLFLASDMLIAARIGLDLSTRFVGPAIWFLYYFGQLLIYLGVSRSLAVREPA